MPDTTCQFCDARAELVNRSIGVEAENRRLRRALFDLQGDEGNVSYTLVLLERIAALEANVERLTKNRGKAA